ncbi:hypothetical protein IFR04_006832 [Cadophora malorum]|uniref:CBM1 domain-containing protein n=1 Tax=Cadophora malorum TaxID=108018 RepID=A0A8H7WAN8_9HELO|nr:hypothetical protein IFR04_006832 [Cadophora malorum]
MRFALGTLLVTGVASAQTLLLEPYAQCGGLGWRGAYDCQSGHSCGPVSSVVGTDAFPRYQCLPIVGPIVPHTFPYGQCGGLNFQGPLLCAPGWSCVVANVYFSTCVENANHTEASVSPTPNLAAPGSYCGETARVRGAPVNCVNGFNCSGPGVYGFYVCLRSQSLSSSASIAHTTTATIFATSTKASTHSSTKSST